MKQYNSTMKGEERTNRVLLFALNKTTALPREGTDSVFNVIFLKKIERPF